MSATTWVYDREGRLRAPFRLLAFAIATVLAFIAVQLVVYPIAMFATSWTDVPPSFGAAMFVVALLVAHWAMFQWVDRGRAWDFAWMGRDAVQPTALLVGLVIGALCIAIPSLAQIGAGLLRIEEADGGRWIETAWRSAVLLLPAAFSEELMIRGYPLAVLREAVGARTALIATSVVFGLLHVLNPGVTAMSIGLVILAGVFLGAMVFVTQSLYAATLAHFAWNWMMAGVLHTPVSGITQFAPAGYRVTDAGPDWITGGRWGPEGGIGAALGMGAGLVFLLSRPRGRALWQRRASREER